VPSRDFVFIDEHGDPGVVGTSTFACVAVHVDDDSLDRMVDCFASLRFFRQVYGEYKNLDKDPQLRPKLGEMLWHLANAHDVKFSVTYLTKAAYTGPYLATGEGTKFRNFQVRRLLEWHFHNFASASPETELVLDRHSHSHGQLENLREYLDGNWNLPTFAALTAVDSRYVEMIAVADLALRMWRRKVLQGNAGWQDLDLSFIQARDVTNMSKYWQP